MPPLYTPAGASANARGLAAAAGPRQRPVRRSALFVRWMADRIPGAQFIEFPGNSNFVGKSLPAVIAAVQELVIGHRAPAPTSRRLHGGQAGSRLLRRLLLLVTTLPRRAGACTGRRAGSRALARNGDVTGSRPLVELMLRAYASSGARSGSAG